MTSPDENERSDGAVKSFLEHLEDLRTALIRSFVALTLGMLVVIPLVPYILEMLKLPLIGAGQDPEKLLATLHVSGGMSIAMRVMFWSGLIVAAPFIVFFIGGFIFPGLRKKERTAVKRLSGFVVMLFMVGVCFGYFCSLPLALQVMFAVNHWIGIPAGPIMIGDYVSFCLQLLLAFGLVFELPAIVVLLGTLGVLSSKQLREKRPHAIVTMMFIAMVITPADVVQMVLMGFPLVLLYEASIWIVRAKERAKALAGTAD